MIKLQTSNSKTNFLLDSTNGFEKLKNIPTDVRIGKITKNLMILKTWIQLTRKSHNETLWKRMLRGVTKEDTIKTVI